MFQKSLKMIYQFVLLSFFLLSGVNCSRLQGINDDTDVKPVVIINVAGHPVFAEKEQNEILSFQIESSDPARVGSLEKVQVIFTDGSAIDNLSSLQIISVDNQGITLGPPTVPTPETVLQGGIKLENSVTALRLVCSVKKNCKTGGEVKFAKLIFSFTGKKVEITGEALSRAVRFGRIIRMAGQDGCHTYRIPGLVTSKKGTLIAVYDNRYASSVDLQGDIDIGMSRSTDGGLTWDPMKVIMNMGKWGGRPEAENGIGDPSILVDSQTGTIWVAALWITGYPGQRAWNCSQPGIDPSVTGQFMLVKSEDDGITWSEPVNITPQVKDPAWRLMLQGPGSGITMKNGTLVFPAQYRDSDGMPYSTIIYSADHGITWKCGKGARSNTTEAQCVELSDGSIMLNMRDNRNGTVKDERNGRAVSVTKDMGKTWIEHQSSNSALPEPVCMASLISARIMISGLEKNVLFFSNPNNKTKRANMTVKASLDEGLTWPGDLMTELNRDVGYGYSSLTMVNAETIGILYEGEGDLYFQTIAVKDILNIK